MRTAQILLTLTIALLITLPGVAQEKKKKGRRGQITPMAQAMIKMMKIRDTLETLDLSEEQQAKLKKMHEEAAPQMKEVYEKMKAILTEEQQAAAETASKEARAAGKEGRQFVVAVETAIKLTDEQKEKMAKLLPTVTEHQKEMLKGIRALLTPEQLESFKKKMAPQKKKKGGQKKEG